MNEEGKQSKSGFSKLFVVAIICLILGGVAGITFFPKKTTETIVSNDTQAYAESYAANLTAEKDAKISELQGTISDLEGKETPTNGNSETIIIEKTSGYLIDELFLELPYNDDLSDRELNIFDGEVEFDGSDYDAEEIFIIDGIELNANSNDFEGKTYLTIPANSVSYKFVFKKKDLDVSLIGDAEENNEDETLLLNLLGEEREIIEWIPGEEITMIQGEVYTLSEGNSTTIEGKVVTLQLALDESVFIDVDGLSIEIDEGQTRQHPNGLQIKVEYSFETTSFRTGEAKLIIGEEVELTIDDGEEYSKDSIWEWDIGDYHIGLVLIKDFTDNEGDFSALSKDEKLCLPENYICLRFNGLIDENSEPYNFEIEEGYIVVEGEFWSNSDNYNEIYINGTGIYDEDFELIDIESIELGNTDSILTLNVEDHKIVINDFELVVDDILAITSFDSTSVGINDYNWLTNYGILVENTKDFLEYDEITIDVPTEEVEGTLSVLDWIMLKEIEEETTPEEAVNETTTI